jgi:hypothetical protein
MKRDLAQAKNPDLRASLQALRRAAALARLTAVQTGTCLVIVQNQKIVKLSGPQLQKSAASD